MEKELTREQSIYRITWIGFFVNLFLLVCKLFAGIIGRSGAMIADGVHSASDFLTDLVILFFVKLSAKPSDESHDYGHGKYETMATIIIGLALLGVAVGIFVKSVELIGEVIAGGVIERPGLVALVAAAVSIAAKEILFRYTAKIGKKVNSSAVIANAWHHRSDAFSSIGTLIGIGGAYFLGEKWRVLDPIAAIVVSLLIAKVAYDLLIPGLNEMLESSLSKDQESEILSVIMEESLFSDPHNLKTRRIGSNIAIEIHVRVDGSMSVSQSHMLTVDVEKKLREKYGPGTLVIVHIEPQK